tara:strand:- start:1473 stop:1694 length:222 start_codon:yes stop_codon:yes gene_type:complete
MTDKNKKTPVNIDGKEVMLEDLSASGQRLVSHATDLDRKILNLGFQLEQIQLGRETVMARLIQEVNTEAEVVN